MAAKKQATKKTTTTTVEEPTGETEELDAFDRARQEFSGEPGVRLTVYRYEDGEIAYLKRVPYDPAAIDEEWIRKKWGPGAYQLRFTDDEGSRRWSKIVQIAADVSPADAPARTTASPAEALFIETIRKQNELMLQAMLAHGAAPPPAAGGSDALVALVQGMQAQNLELLRSAVNRPDISATLLQVLERGMAIASESRADAEGGWLAQVARIAREVLPSMAEMARARAMTPPMMPPPLGAVPVVGAGSTNRPGLPAGAPPGNGAPLPSAPPSPSSPPLDLDELVRSYAPSILDAIENRAAPDDVADAILGYLPPALYDELAPLTAERAIRAAPALSQHRGYVEQLVAALREAIEEDDARPSA